MICNPTGVRTMNGTSPRKTMRDVTSSLVGSCFRRVLQDGRVTFARKITTLGQLKTRPRDASKT